MTDFYAQLEQQLVAAGYRRQTRGRVARAVAGRGRALVAATAAVAVLVAGGAVALPSVFDTASTSRPAAPRAVPAPAPAPVRGGGLAGIRVAIFNATSRTGLARGIAGILESRGARIVGLGAANTTPRRSRTAVFYGRGRVAQGQAQLVASLLGAAVLGPASPASSVPDPRALGERADVVVILGADTLRRLPATSVPATPRPATPLPAQPTTP